MQGTSLEFQTFALIKLLQNKDVHTVSFIPKRNVNLAVNLVDLVAGDQVQISAFNTIIVLKLLIIQLVFALTSNHTLNLMNVCMNVALDLI